MGHTKAAKIPPKNGPTKYIQICLIGFLSPPAITWTRAGPKDLAGLREHEEIFPPITFKEIKTEAKANPKVGPN